jgi:hypothetical protein
MAIVFAWDDWNREHVTKHGCTAMDAKFVVDHAAGPFPQEIGDDKFVIWGQNESGRHLQVVLAFKIPAELEFNQLELLDWGMMIDYVGTIAVYVIHAMPLTRDQLRRYRKLMGAS